MSMTHEARAHLRSCSGLTVVCLVHLPKDHLASAAISRHLSIHLRALFAVFRVSSTIPRILAYNASPVTPHAYMHYFNTFGTIST